MNMHSPMASTVWTIALLVACGGHQAPTTPVGAPADCFALLIEPAAVDCSSREPLSPDAIRQRRAADACLLETNRAALERAKASALQTHALTPANLPTVEYSEIVTDEWHHTRDQLVPLRTASASCLQRPLAGESIVARDATGQLVRIDLVPDVIKTRRIESCACTGCGPVPPPGRVDFAILPPGTPVTRTISVPWPVQIIELVPLVGACS